jgi:hypothetical protein
MKPGQIEQVRTPALICMGAQLTGQDGLFGCRIK